MIGIILARLLSPAEFGLVGMVTIFIAIADTFIDGGFRQALLRKKTCSQNEYCTVYHFNLLVGAALYILLFVSANAISGFFNEPQLKELLRVLGLVVIIKSFSLIQTVILTKRLDFKLQTKISVTATILSGSIGIILAYNGFGVWSLVAKTVINQLLITVFLWTFNKWRSSLVFDREAFKEMFGFGSKVLANSILGTVYNQIFKTVIARFYSAETLGYYSRAEQFKSLPSATLSGLIQRVTLPVLAQIQDDKQKLKLAYKKLIKATMLLSFSMMMGLAAIANNLIIVLIGEQWLPSVSFLQLLCFAAILYPLHHFNYSALNLKGRSDLVLKGNVYLKIFSIPAIILGIYVSIYLMIVGIIINTFIAYIIFSRWSGKLLGYPVKEQLADLAPSVISASIMALIVHFMPLLFIMNPLFMLLIQISTGVILFLILNVLLNKSEMTEILVVVKSTYNKTNT